MAGVVVVGSMWGDEGKGKVTDYLAQKADVVCRYAGGNLSLIHISKFKIIQNLIDRLNLTMRENLSGMLVIRAFGNEKHSEDRFDKANKDVTNLNLFVNRSMASITVSYTHLFLCQMISKMAMPKNIMTPFLVIFLKPMFMF